MTRKMREWLIKNMILEDLDMINIQDFRDLPLQNTKRLRHQK